MRKRREEGGGRRNEEDWSGLELISVRFCHSGSTHSDEGQDFLDLRQFLSVIILEIENLGM